MTTLRKVVNRMEAVASAVGPNGFAALMAAQIAAAGATGLDAGVTVYKRQSALTFAARKQLPGLGLYVIGANTNVLRGGPVGVSGWRDATVRACWDYFATGPSAAQDPVKLTEQAELAASTIWQLIDRMAEDQSTGVIGAGEERNSIVTEIRPMQNDAVTVNGIRVLVMAPIIQEERNL